MVTLTLVPGRQSVTEKLGARPRREEEEKDLNPAFYPGGEGPGEWGQ
jgi:hypothetical protein